jgi:signal transduction histidine kinase
MSSSAAARPQTVTSLIVVPPRMRHHQDPERSRAALEAIEEVARQTAGEIDQIVGTMRERSAEKETTTVPPGLASLQTLVAQRWAGELDVTVSTTGSPRPLDRAVDLAAYRILQEALTNAARHGKGRAQIEVAYEEATLGLTITNPVREAKPPSTKGGNGLIGMRERTTMLGGTVHAARANGTFRLRVQLPYRGQRP